MVPSGSTGIVILGMHRSGTSALSRLMQELGCALGGDGIPAAPDNPHGYHEHAAIVAIHDDFLRLCGRTWSDPRPFSPGDFQGPAAQGARARLKSTFERDLRPLPRWVLKDPRMCRLLPLWNEILQPPAALDVSFLHVVRSPLAVAQSLAQRDRIGLEKSFLLWVRHNVEAEAGSRGSSRAWVDWDEFQRAPQASLRRACRSGRLGHALDLARLGAAIERAFVAESVHHPSGGEDERTLLEAFPWVRLVHEAVGHFCRGDGRQGDALMDQVRTELARADALMMSNPSMWENEAQQDRAARMTKEIESVRGELPYLSALLGKALDVTSRLEEALQTARRERDALAHERDELLRNREAAAQEREASLRERDQLARERDGLVLERDALVEQQVTFLEERDAERTGLARARDQLLAECDGARRERDAVRDYFLGSRSWRLTAPLRRLMNALRGTSARWP